MITDTARAVADSTHDSREILRRLMNTASDAWLEGDWYDVHAEAVRLLKEHDAWPTTPSPSTVDAWLGAVEDLANEATLLPWPDPDDY